MTQTDGSQDPYTCPQTSVLRNLLGIADSAVLAQVEADLTFAKSIWLTENPIPGTYDLAHLQEFHRALFTDIYDWAGELRTVAISRTELFCLPQHIESFATEVFGALRNEMYLRGLPRSRFVDRLAHHLGEVNALHPFREGNGRTQRAFLGQLAREAGWHVQWARLDRSENDAASRASLAGHPEPLRTLVDALVERM